MILGVVGRFGAGKDTVADYLKNLGFAHFSLSDIIREECKKHNLELSIPNLVKMGNSMRESDPGILAEIAKKRMKESGGEKFVVTSIRNAFEAEALKKYGKVNIIKIDAPFDLRYKRVTARKTHGSEMSPMQFYEREKEQLFGDAKKLSMLDVFRLADFVVYNTGSEGELNKKIDRVIDMIKARENESGRVRSHN
jgi:dephospho-CoA kinase